MTHDKISGPIPREKLKELADMPFGAAARAIQKYDPQWGRAPGEKFEWVVRVERDSSGRGVAYVLAANQKEADELADALQADDIDWDRNANGFLITSVEPAKK